MKENTYEMQLTKMLLVLCLLRVPTTLAFSSGAPPTACVDPSDTSIYYRASTGHNSNKHSSKTAWVEIYDPTDETTKLSCVEQSKHYIVKLKATANMKGILMGANRGVFPDMETTELRALSLRQSHCTRTITHDDVLYQTSEISLPFVTSNKRKGIEFRYAVTFDLYDNLDNKLDVFPLCPEKIPPTTVIPTPSVSLPPDSTQITSSSFSAPTPNVTPTVPPTPSMCQGNCTLQEGEKCAKVSGSHNENQTYITPKGESYICHNLKPIKTLQCEPSCTKDLTCGMACQLQCSVVTVVKERKFWCTPEKDSSLKDIIKKFNVVVHKSCSCDIV